MQLQGCKAGVVASNACAPVKFGMKRGIHATEGEREDEDDYSMFLGLGRAPAPPTTRSSGGAAGGPSGRAAPRLVLRSGATLSTQNSLRQPIVPRGGPAALSQRQQQPLPQRPPQQKQQQQAARAPSPALSLEDLDDEEFDPEDSDDGSCGEDDEEEDGEDEDEAGTGSEADFGLAPMKKGELQHLLADKRRMELGLPLDLHTSYFTRSGGLDFGASGILSLQPSPVGSRAGSVAASRRGGRANEAAQASAAAAAAGSSSSSGDMFLFKAIMQDSTAPQRSLSPPGMPRGGVGALEPVSPTLLGQKEGRGSGELVGVSLKSAFLGGSTRDLKGGGGAGEGRVVKFLPSPRGGGAREGVEGVPFRTEAGEGISAPGRVAFAELGATSCTSSSSSSSSSSSAHLMAAAGKDAGARGAGKRPRPSSALPSLSSSALPAIALQTGAGANGIFRIKGIPGKKGGVLMRIMVRLVARVLRCAVP